MDFQICKKHILTLLLLSFVSLQNYCQETNAIVVGSRPLAGFFSNFLGVLNWLNYCSSRDMDLVVLWNQSNSSYFDAGYNPFQPDNVWEYYFYPVSSRAYNGEAVISGLDAYYAPTGTVVRDNPSILTEDSRKNGHTLIEKYIRVKEHIIEKVDDFYEQYLKAKYIIGIHYRGSDKYLENRPIDMNKVVTIANELASKQESVVFFIATDSIPFIDMAKKGLIRPFYCYDSYRTSGNEPIFRKPSPAIIGEQAVIDMLLLARCNFLLRTSSNLSTVSLLFNPDIPEMLLWEGNRHRF